MIEQSEGPTGGQPAPGSGGGGEEPVPVMQRILDNPFILLFLGVAIPTVLYLLWGVMELAQVPVAK